jgi:hypothetical protein
MRDGSERGTKEISIAWGRHTATVIGVISFPMLATNDDILRTVHHALIIQAVKQTVQLPRKSAHRRDSHATFNTCSGLVKVYRTYHEPTVVSGKTCQDS